MTTKETNHAIDNAKGWLASIRDMVAALEPEECAACGRWHRDAVEPGIVESGDKQEVCEDEAAGDTEDEARDTARQRIEESVLSVLVRGDWHGVGDDDAGREPVEAEILLTTGGPALRLMVELEDRQPRRAYLQWQDWGTPWTDFVESGTRDALLAFASVFYFGD